MRAKPVIGGLEDIRPQILLAYLAAGRPVNCSVISAETLGLWSQETPC
jgi:hypothetical protein